MERCTCGVYGGECKRRDFTTRQFVACDPTVNTESIKQKICSSAPGLAEAAMVECRDVVPAPPGYEVFGVRSVTFDQPFAITTDDNELLVVRVTGTTAQGTSRRLAAAESEAKGPVLLTHGIGNDGSVWL